MKINSTKVYAVSSCPYLDSRVLYDSYTAALKRAGEILFEDGNDSARVIYPPKVKHGITIYDMMGEQTGEVCSIYEFILMREDEDIT